jgi:hypothetical protein
MRECGSSVYDPFIMGCRTKQALRLVEFALPMLVPREQSNSSNTAASFIIRQAVSMCVDFMDN